MPLTISIFVLLELLLALVATILMFRRYHYSATEAFSYSVAFLFAIYSSTIQLFLVARIIHLYFLVDVLVLGASALIIIKQFPHLRALRSIIIDNVKQHQPVVVLFLIMWTYLLLQALLLPPLNIDAMTYTLPRILMMQHENNLFLGNYSNFPQANFSVAYDILHFLFLRAHSDYFLGVFSFLSYATVMASAYALVTNVWKDPKLSFVTTCMMGSLTTIVLQSTSTKNDLPSAAMVAVCILSAYRYTKSRNGFDLAMLTTSLLLGISFKSYVGAFALPFIFLYALHVFRLLPFRAVIRSLTVPLRYLPVILVPLSVLLCFALFSAHNLKAFGSWYGTPKSGYHQNDGIRGAGANALRYVVQAMDVPPFLGGRYLDRLNRVITLGNPHLGAAAAWVQEKKIQLGAPFVPAEGYSWYGPLAFLIILPAILYSIARGDGFTRTCALSLAFFWCAICYKIGWMHSNSRFFSLFFGASALCTAFFIHRLLGHKILKYLIIISLITGCYAATTNRPKPLLNIYTIIYDMHQHVFKKGDSFQKREAWQYPFGAPLIFPWLHYVVNRDAHFNNRFLQGELEQYKNLIEPNKRVLLIADPSAWVLPFLIRRRDLDITVCGPSHVFHDGEPYDIADVKEFFFVSNYYDYILLLGLLPFSTLEENRLLIRSERMFLYDYRQ